MKLNETSSSVYDYRLTHTGCVRSAKLHEALLQILCKKEDSSTRFRPASIPALRQRYGLETTLNGCPNKSTVNFARAELAQHIRNLYPEKTWTPAEIRFELELLKYRQWLGYFHSWIDKCERHIDSTSPASLLQPLHIAYSSFPEAAKGFQWFISELGIAAIPFQSVSFSAEEFPDIGYGFRIANQESGGSTDILVTWIHGERLKSVEPNAWFHHNVLKLGHSPGAQRVELIKLLLGYGPINLSALKIPYEANEDRGRWILNLLPPHSSIRTTGLILPKEMLSRKYSIRVSAEEFRHARAVSLYGLDESGKMIENENLQITLATGAKVHQLITLGINRNRSIPSHIHIQTIRSLLTSQNIAAPYFYHGARDISCRFSRGESRPLRRISFGKVVSIPRWYSFSSVDVFSFSSVQNGPCFGIWESGSGPGWHAPLRMWRIGKDNIPEIINDHEESWHPPAGWQVKSLCWKPHDELTQQVIIQLQDIVKNTPVLSVHSAIRYNLFESIRSFPSAIRDLTVDSLDLELDRFRAGNIGFFIHAIGEMLDDNSWLEELRSASHSPIYTYRGMRSSPVSLATNLEYARLNAPKFFKGTLNQLIKALEDPLDKTILKKLHF